MPLVHRPSHPTDQDPIPPDGVAFGRLFALYLSGLVPLILLSLIGTHIPKSIGYALARVPGELTN